MDTKSLLVGAGVGVAALTVFSGMGKKSGGSSTKKKAKGLGSTYVVSGTARKVSAKKAGATKKAAGISKRKTKKK